MGLDVEGRLSLCVSQLRADQQGLTLLIYSLIHVGKDRGGGGSALAYNFGGALGSLGLRLRSHLL